MGFISTDLIDSPNVEVFYAYDAKDYYDTWGRGFSIAESGWHFWARFPGGLPDGPAFGPFETEAEAIAEAHAIYIPKLLNIYQYKTK